MRMPIVKQHDEKDCGAACLAMVAEFYGHKLPLVQCRQLIQVDNNGANLYSLIQGGNDIGLAAQALQGSADELIEELSKGTFTFPFIARIITEDMFEHYVVVYKVHNHKVWLGDPAKGRVRYSDEAFFAMWTGHIVTYQKTDDFQKRNDRKGTLRKFTKLITDQKKLIASVVLVSFVISLVSLIGSLVFEYIVNQIIYAGQETSGTSKIFERLFSGINSICIAVVILYVFQSGIQVLRNYLLANMSKNMDISLTTEFFRHLIHLPIGFFGSRKSGEILSRFDDASNIREALSSTILTLIVDSVMAIFFGAYLCFISVPLFLISLSIMLAYGIIVCCFRKPIRKINQEGMENGAQVTSYLKESIEGIETIKAFQVETNTETTMDTLYKNAADTSAHGSILYGVKDALISLTASAGVVFLLWTGYRLCDQGVIQLGSLVTFYLVLNYFLSPLQSLIELQPTIQSAIVAANRLNDVLELPVEFAVKDYASLDLNGDIIFDNITFRYGYRFPTIQELTLRVKHGQKIAIVGESGSGKTTLMRLLMRFYQPESGQILVNGMDIGELDPNAVRSRIAYVSQNVFFFSGTIRSNLVMGNDHITDEQLEHACKLAMADSFIEDLPMGYDTILSENASNLSGGQRQRLSIARALLRNPDILILDEATSNLDVITEQSIKQTVFDASNQLTTFIIAHRLTTIRNCDVIAVMENGSIVETGTHDELMALNGAYKRFFESNS